MPTIKNSIAALRTNFDTALSDGKVSLDEAQDLIAKVSEDKVTQSERRQFRELFYSNKDKFDADAATRMNKFIDEEIPALLIPDDVIGNGGTGTVDDPAALNKHKDWVKWESVNGQLFVDGIDGDDVEQGQIGDCYFAASMAAVAHEHPELIENMFKQNDDGTLTVTFKERDWSGNVKDVPVKIDGDLPLRWGGLLYAHARDNKELWVPLLEKAYAQWKGGYEAIGNGGSPGTAMSAMTGGRQSSLWVSPDSDTNELWQQLKDATDAKKCVAAGTYGENSDVKYDGTGVYADHAYSVWGTAEKDGVKYVQLRNPWGEVEPGNDGKDDGIFLMPIETFVKLYQNVNIVDAPPAPAPAPAPVPAPNPA